MQATQSAEQSYPSTSSKLFKCVIVKLRQGYGSNFKPLSKYYNETVQCGGKKGDSVKIEQTSCVMYLRVYKMKVYGTALGKYE